MTLLFVLLLQIRCYCCGFVESMGLVRSGVTLETGHGKLLPRGKNSAMLRLDMKQVIEACKKNVLKDGPYFDLQFNGVSVYANNIRCKAIFCHCFAMDCISLFSLSQLK